MAWFPDPFSEKEPSKEAAEYYKNRSQGWHNWIFVTAMVLLYVIYFLKVRKIARGQKSKASTAVSWIFFLKYFFYFPVSLKTKK